MSTDTLIQVSVFFLLTGAVGLFTWLKCRKAKVQSDDTREHFLAGGNLGWFYIAGSITLTNINTDTFVGMSGAQTMVAAWWELAGFAGLLLLAYLFLPIYYKYKCTTVTELLERRYNNKHVRATVGIVFLVGNLFLFLPAMLYTCSRLMQDMFGITTPIMVLAVFGAVVGSVYAIFGGLRAVAVSDTYNGVIVLGLGLIVLILSLNRVHWDLGGLPAERMTLWGDDASPVPWKTLLTGMVFCQLYYWSTNQTITQRALAAESLKEARKGVLAAAFLRITIIPPMMVVPGLCAYKLFGPIGDASYGRIAAEVLPHWMTGAFAASMVAAMVSSFCAVLNSTAAIYVCDIHQPYINSSAQVGKLSFWLQTGFGLFAIALVPLYASAEGIFGVIQQVLGMFSMPMLSAFIIGLLFRGIKAGAIISTIFFGAALYASLTFGWDALYAAHPQSVVKPWHFLHLMAVTVLACVAFSLLANRLVFGGRASLVFGRDEATARS